MSSDQWTVKYAPKSMNDLVGNKSNYAKLFTWLKTYYDSKPSERGEKFKFLTLLVGPPGIGKTSGIVALAKELKYELIELNASDQRNERVINKLVGRETKTFVNPGFNGKIVLLDEVDGIQGREDKGGLAALMRVARESVHPIICTANDPQSDKIRSLKKSPITNFLEFKKPTAAEMTVLLENIVKRENITVPPKLLSVICENAHGDIRGAVNDLENLSQERSEIPMNAIQALSIRDSEVSIDLALRQIFGEAKTLRQAHEVTSDLDVDYSMFMQYVVENIPSHVAYPAELESMFSNAALADLFYGRIMTTQHWKYLKYYFYFLSAGVRASKISEYRQSYSKFPMVLMILSRTKKTRAIRNSVTLKFGKLTHSSKNKINNFSLPYIRMFFEQLFESYINNKLETPEGQNLLTTVSSIHNEIELDEDEFIYLFNDPLYEKQTAAEEKNQKKLIKIIEEKDGEIRLYKIDSHNKNLNDLMTFQEKEDIRSRTDQISKSKGQQREVLSQEQSSDENSVPKISTTKKKRTKKTIEATSETNKALEELDTFDLEEEAPKKTKKSKKIEKTVKKEKTSLEKQGTPAETSTEVPVQKPSQIKTTKDKQKNLFEFTAPKKDQSDKKKKESKNLMDFM